MSTDGIGTTIKTHIPCELEKENSHREQRQK